MQKRPSKTDFENLYLAFYPTNFTLNRTKNAEFVLQNRKTFVTLLREFYFFGNENKIISFSSVRITLKGDDVRLGFLVANIGKISSNKETINKVIKFRKNKKR